VAQVARELGLRVNKIYKWRKQLEEKQDSAFSGKQTAMDKDVEIRRLKKALAASQEENEFLKLNGVRAKVKVKWGQSGFLSHFFGDKLN